MTETSLSSEEYVGGIALKHASNGEADVELRYPAPEI